MKFLLLEDAFESFQNMYLIQYIRSSTYYVAPALGWLALLKTSSELFEHETKCIDTKICLEKFRLELFTDIGF